MSSITNKEPAAVAALVVGYRPDLATLDALLLRLLAEVRLVVLLDNGGAEAYLTGRPGQRSRVRHVDMGGNCGLGAALNRGMSEARASGLRYVMTFDQDSCPPPGMVEALFAAMLCMQAHDAACVAVGPAFYDVREKGERCFPLYREANGGVGRVDVGGNPEPQAVDMLITSGMLVDSNAWDGGLRYEEGLMVDYTDSDWCFRARAAGKRLYALGTARMPHALSDARPVRLFGIHLLRYSPLRRYYYFRNTVYFVRRPYVSSAWRRRLLAGMALRLPATLFIDAHPLGSLVMSLKGLWHGVRGRLGAYPS